MKTVRYSMAFTTGGLFHHESVRLANLYLELGDWTAVRNRVISDNLLQTRTLNTLKRIYQEVVSRLNTLNLAEIELLTQGSHQEQTSLLWVAICRRYRFIADFSIEVLRERYLTLKPDLTYEDFDAFYNQKSEWHAELDALTPRTRSKLRQVLFKMLREAELLTAGNLITSPILTQRLLTVLPSTGQDSVAYFPVFNVNLKRASACPSTSVECRCKTDSSISLP